MGSFHIGSLFCKHAGVDQRTGMDNLLFTSISNGKQILEKK
jgi:hypothetical protein